MRRYPRDQYHPMSTANQMLSQGLMIIPRRLPTEDYLGKPRLHLHRFRLHQKLPKSLQVILKNQSLEKRLPGGRAKKSMVLVFGHIDAHKQILARSPNLFPELTKIFYSGTIFLVHRKPPV